MRTRLLTEPRRPESVRRSPRAHWYVVGTVCIGAFMGQLDASIVTVALPHIGDSLHVGAAEAQWVALSYLLVLLFALVFVGQLADRLGRKLLYTYGFAVFTIGSALCGLAPSLGLLVAARILQALGASMLQANSVALIREAMPSAELPRGIGVQGAAQAMGLAMGPAVGGLLLALGGWRLIFFVNLPVGVIGLILARLLLPRSRLAQQPAETRLRSIGTLLRTPAISFGLGSGLVSYLVMFGTLFVVPYYLVAAGIGPTAAGLELASLPLALGVVAPLAGRASGRIGPRPLMIGGLALTAVGLTVLALMHGGAGRLAGLMLAGAGIGAFTPVNNAAVMGAGPRSRAGVLGGILNMTRTLGAIVGVALASALYSASIGRQTLPKAVSEAASGHGLTISLLVLAALAALAAAMLLFESVAAGESPQRDQEQ